MITVLKIGRPLKKLIIKLTEIDLFHLVFMNRTAISLFSGAGGDTLGLENASYHVVAFSEFVTPFIRTHQIMFPHSKLLEYKGQTDIRMIPDEVFTQYKGTVNLVFAGFPCQGFSHAGRKKESDPRNELVYEFVRAVKCIRPEWIIGENVSGLLSRKGTNPKTGIKTGVIEIIESIFNDIGYSLTWRVVTATDFGVPQKRNRLIIIGHDNQSNPSTVCYPHFDWNSAMIPNDSKSIRMILENTLEGAVEFSKVGRNIPVSDDKPSIWVTTQLKEPPNTVVHPNLLRLVNGIRTKKKDELMKNPTPKTVVVPGGLISIGRRSSGYHGEIVDPDQPSKTIICTYGTCPRLFVGMYNPEINKYWIRTFTVTELAQIQSFPKDYQFNGNMKDIITQIGNAVPSKIITAIVSHLQSVVFKPYKQLDDTDVRESEMDDTDD